MGFGVARSESHGQIFLKKTLRKVACYPANQNILYEKNSVPFWIFIVFSNSYCFYGNLLDHEPDQGKELPYMRYI